MTTILNTDDKKKGLRPGIGYVLVEIPPEINSVKTATGVQFFVDTSYSTGQFANIWAVVVEVPDKLTSRSLRANRDRKGHKSPDSEVLCQKGDKVYFSYLALKNAKKNYHSGKYWEEDGKRYAILPYSILFFAVRKTKKQSTEKLGDLTIYHGTIEKPLMVESTKYIMLNNWFLIEPIGIAQHTEKFEKYGHVVIDDERSTGNIALISETGYKGSEGKVAACPPGLGVEPGETIIFERESDIPVEYDLCKTLDKPYWRMELKDVIAKRIPGGVELLQDYCLILQDPEISRSELDMWPIQPTTGEIVMTSKKVTKVEVGQHVFFQERPWTEFPLKDGRMGILVHEGEIFLLTEGHQVIKP